MTRIFIEDTFYSSHFLPNLPKSHKCSRMHGHSYRIRLEIGGEINPRLGWIIDYTDAKRVWFPIHAQLDHATLNDIKGLENPTAENIAKWIWSKFIINEPNLKRIEIRETEHSGVVYEGAD